jgi:flagellin
MRINNNIMAMNAHRQLGMNQAGAAKSMEKLSSGFRINRAGDDAAGLAISEKMRGQIRGLKQASRNAQDGISLIQTAEGALNETHSILQRMRELAVQASTDTNTDKDRLEIQKEVNELIDEIDRIANDTQFNTMELLDGSLEGADDGLVFHIGANAEQSITLNIASMLSEAIGSSDTKTIESLKDEDLGGEKGVQTQEAADAAITIIDDAIGNVSAERSKLGAYQNRLEHTINNLGTSAENLQAAEARIRDLDMAEEIMAFTKNNILQQAATAMLAQANMAPQSVLQLLG